MSLDENICQASLILYFHEISVVLWNTNFEIHSLVYLSNVLVRRVQRYTYRFPKAKETV